MKRLNQFIAEFRDGFQPSNRFTAQLFVPQALINAISTSPIQDVINILFPRVGRRIDQTFSAAQTGSWLGRGLVCETSRLPSRSFEQVSQTMYGYSEKYPFHTEYTDLECSFLLPLVTNDNAVPRFFNYWLNFIQNQFSGPESGMNFTFPDTYRGQLFLTMYDRQHHATLSYMFDKVYPKVVESVPISWDTQNEFAKLPVSFTYSYWKLLPYAPPPIVEITTPFIDVDISVEL